MVEKHHTVRYTGGDKISVREQHLKNRLKITLPSEDRFIFFFFDELLLSDTLILFS